MMLATRRNWLALSLALLPGLAAAAPEAVPLYREIKDWVVGCDNTRACTAVAAAQNQSEEPQLMLAVHREAGRDGALSVQMQVQGSEDWAGLMMIDGDTQEYGRFARTTDPEGVFKVHGAQAAALLGRLRKGDLLTGETANERYYASLNGLSAALLLIDSVQGRVGHASALVRPGKASDASVPGKPALAPLPPYPVPAPLLAQQLPGIRAAVIAQAKAQQVIVDDPGEGEISVQPLDTGHALVMLVSECGAYQCAYTFYKVGRSAPHAVEALPFEALASAELEDELGGSVDFDERSGVLASFAKARGIGDCGTEQAWRYDGQRMQLKALYKMQRCAGVPSGYWPALWQRAE